MKVGTHPVKRKFMANQRKPDKRKIGFYADEFEAQELLEAARIAGFKTLADYLRWIAEAKPKPNNPRPTSESSDGGESRSNDGD